MGDNPSEAPFGARVMRDRARRRVSALPQTQPRQAGYSRQVETRIDQSVELGKFCPAGWDKNVINRQLTECNL